MDFEFNADMFNQIPIWVKFPSQLVGYWSVRALSKVSSAIGMPLNTDGFTATAEKITYARVLIEQNISKNLPDAIIAETPSGPWNQPIEYKWIPKFCNHCIRLGHKDAECWYKLFFYEDMVETDRLEEDDKMENQMGQQKFMVREEGMRAEELLLYGNQNTLYLVQRIHLSHYLNLILDKLLP